MAISSYNCLNVCKIQYRTWNPRDQGKASLFWRKTVCSTSNRNPTPYSLYDCIAVSAHNKVSFSLLGRESRDVYFFKDPNSLQTSSNASASNEYTERQRPLSFHHEGKISPGWWMWGVHSTFWAQMALASLVEISRPKNKPPAKEWGDWWHFGI